MYYVLTHTEHSKISSTEQHDLASADPHLRVSSLIDQAAAKAGSRYKLARMIGRSDAELAQWRKGVRACPIPAQALMAEVAGLEATEVALYALIESEKDPQRKEALVRVLGKGLLHTIAAASSAIFASAIWGSDAVAATVPQLIRCIVLLNRKRTALAF